MGNISSVLKAKRKELGLTLAQIAEKIGVTEVEILNRYCMNALPN